jgi:hypothetical protein
VGGLASVCDCLAKESRGKGGIELALPVFQRVERDAEDVVKSCAREARSFCYEEQHYGIPSADRSNEDAFDAGQRLKITDAYSGFGVRLCRCGTGDG